MPHKHQQTTIDRAIAQNLTVTDAMVRDSQTLREVARDFVAECTASNPFIKSLQTQLAAKGSLSVPQMRGALNVMIADAKYQKRLEAATPVLIDLSTPSKVDEVLLATLPATPKIHNGTYTVLINDQGDYRTLRLVDAPEALNQPKGTQVAQYLSGPDNTSNYTGFAFVSGDQMRLWKKFAAKSDLSFALIKLLASDGYEAGKNYAMRSGKCFICGRKLTTPDSIVAGIGPICAGNIGLDTAELATSSRARAEQAKKEIDELFPD